MQSNIDLNTTCSIECQKKNGVYCILNTITNKFYIGSVLPTTKRNYFRRRWQKHMIDLLSNQHINPHLQNSFNLYGREAFKFFILETIHDINLILPREQHWMDITKCYSEEIGYNVNPKAQCSNREYVVSKETKAKLKKLGKPRPMWMKIQYGKPILQYTLDGVFIREWYSNMEASRVLNIGRVSIKHACQGKQNKAGGFKWVYKNNINN